MVRFFQYRCKLIIWSVTPFDYYQPKYQPLPSKHQPPPPQWSRFSVYSSSHQQPHPSVCLPPSPYHGPSSPLAPFQYPFFLAVSSPIQVVPGCLLGHSLPHSGELVLEPLEDFLSSMTILPFSISQLGFNLVLM